MISNSGHHRLVFVVNSPIALAYLQGQPRYFQGRGFDVTILCPSRREGEWEVALPDGISTVAIPMERKIAPLRDLLSLWRLWCAMRALRPAVTKDRKSTRLNSSHPSISYAVFCLKKKKTTQ